MFQAHKKSIKCSNDRVAAIPGISGSVNGGLHIDSSYHPTNFPVTIIEIDTLVNTALNIEDDEDEHKYTSGWDMLRLDEKLATLRSIQTFLSMMWPSLRPLVKRINKSKIIGMFLRTFGDDRTAKVVS